MRIQVVFFLFTVLFSTLAQAGAVITYHGRITDVDDKPIDSNSVTFKVQIYSPNPGKCLLYEETRTVSMHDTNGVFVIPIGDGNGTRTTNDPNIAVEKVFNNDPAFTFDTTKFPKLNCNSGGNAFTPQALDQRQLVVTFKDNNSANLAQVLPNMDVNFVPYSVNSYDAQNVGGTPASRMLSVSTGAATPLTAANFTELLAILNGSSTQYAKSGTLGGSNLPSLSAGESLKWNGSAWVGYTPLASAVDPNVKAFAKANLPTCGANTYLKPKGDGSGFDCIALPAAGTGTMTSVSAGTGIKTDQASNAAITTTGAISVDVGTSANQIVQMGSDTKLPAVDGSKLTNVVATGLSSTASISTSGAISTTNNIQTTKDMTANRFFLYNNGGIGPESVGLKSSDAMATGASYTVTMPLTKGTANQFLKIDSITGSNAQLMWDNVAAGSSGTLSSVGMSLPTDVFTVTGSPLIADGSISAALKSQTQKQVLAAPNAADGVPVFRQLAVSDISNAKSAALYDAPVSGNAGTTELVKGDDSRLTNARAVAGTVGIGNGGTGVTSFTADRILATTAGGALSFLTCTQGQILGFNGTGVYGCYSPENYSIFSVGGNTVTSTAILGTKSNHDISFITNNTEKMVLQADGKLGVGRAPAYAVDVNGAVNANEIRIAGELVGRGIQDPARTVAALGDVCPTVGALAKTTGGELLVCDEDTTALSTTNCTTVGVGAVTFDRDGGMHVCTE